MYIDLAHVSIHIQTHHQFSKCMSKGNMVKSSKKHNKTQKVAALLKLHFLP